MIILSALCIGAIEEGKPMRKAEGVERIVAVRGEGYFPVMIRLKDGELLAVIRGGAPHVGVGGRLDLIRSSDGGRNWSEPKVIVDLPPDSRNPAFGQAENGRLILAFAVTGSYEGGRFTAKTSEYTVWLTVSDDKGKSWSKPCRLDISPLRYGSPFGKIVSLPDGTLLMNIYGWSDRREYGSYLFRSKDDGLSWGDPSLIAEGYNETALLTFPDGKVLALLRNGLGTHRSISEDGGYTWSEPKEVLGRGFHPADAIALKSGAILMTTGHRLEPFGVFASLSRDGGSSWDVGRGILLDWGSENTDCGYPSSAQLDDGTIVTIYYGVRHRDYPDLNRYAICIRYTEAVF
jgi:hypothetical protein